MVGVDSDERYSCPLFSKIVHNGDGVERGRPSHPRTRDRSALRMAAACPHSHQLHQSIEHGLHDEAWSGYFALERHFFD